MFRIPHRLYFGLILITLLLALTVQGMGAQDVGVTPQCPLGQGYWKNTATWPVVQITLGSQVYTQPELLVILNTPAADDASLNLAHQLIAAKLSIANGADSSVANGIIAQAEALLTGFNGKLPYRVAPSSDVGQTMVSLAGVLDVYNSGQLSINCSVTPTPMPAVTPETTPEATPDTDDNDLPITIVIEGPVQAININIITIYNITVEVNPTDPILTVIQVGDIVRVEGNTQNRNGVIIIVAVTVILVDSDVVIIDDDTVWRDNGNCDNPPPDWAPAHGWRRRCQSGDSDEGKDKKKGKDKDDDDDD